MRAIFANNYIDERTEDMASLTRRLSHMRRLEAATEGSGRKLLERPAARLFDPQRRIKEFTAMFHTEDADAAEDEAGAKRQLRSKPWSFATQGNVLACNQRPGLTAAHYNPSPESLNGSAPVPYNGTVTTYGDGTTVHEDGNSTVVLMDQCPPSLFADIMPGHDAKKEEEPLPDSHLLWYKLEVTCLPPESAVLDASVAVADCVNATAIKAALRQYLPVSRHSNTPSSISDDPAKRAEPCFVLLCVCRRARIWS